VPSRDEHLEKAASNADLAADLAASRRHPDWAVVALFYEALHLIEARFANDGVHHASHFSRNR
jgi:hypothetical protein